MTPTQRATLKLFDSLQRKLEGVSPTTTEIAAAQDKYIAAAHGVLCRLERDGYLKRVAKGARALIITEAGREALLNG